MEDTNIEKMKKTHPSWKKTHVGIIIAVVLVCLLGYSLAGLLLNRKSVVVQVIGSQSVNVEFGDTYEDAGAKAYEDNSMFFFVRPKLEVSTDDPVDSKKLGTYDVTYKAEDNDLTGSSTRTVIVEDTTPPDIQLVTNPDSYTPYNHPYTEEGYTATDICDGDLTSQVKSEEKDGIVTYTVSDSSGNIATVTRTIHYDDRLGPVITLNGGDTVTVYAGDAYTDSYTAIDDVDGDVTSKVTVTGTVDANTVGIYTLQYAVSDAHGNESTATRTVNVKVRPTNVITNENNKTIYLTFDDGPGQYTEQLLDILDKYNVKATFFTTSAHPEYAGMIAQEAARGHAVAVHTYTHNYGQIYTSTDAYWADFNRQNAVVAQQTGSYATMFRFPGGSSNTVSENYSSGIMTKLSQQADAMGYVYFDWNVSSGDAGGTTDTSTVYQNVVNQVTANSNYGIPSVVLQHDVKGFSVNAVESIIRWGLENGYSFQRLYAGSYHAHQRIAN